MRAEMNADLKACIKKNSRRPQFEKAYQLFLSLISIATHREESLANDERQLGIMRITTYTAWFINNLSRLTPRLLVGKTPFGQAESVDADIIADFVDSLYFSPLTILLYAAIGGFCVTLVTGLRTGIYQLYACSLIFVIAGTWRIASAVRYRSLRKELSGDTELFFYIWEKRYAIGAAAYAACYGWASFITLSQTDDLMSQLLTCLASVGVTVGFVTRNYGRTAIVIIQSFLAVGPIVVASSLRGGVDYYSISLLSSLYIFVSIEVAKQLYRTKLSMLRLIKENNMLVVALEETSRNLDIAFSNMSHGIYMLDADQRVIVSNKRTHEIYGISTSVICSGMHINDIVLQIIAAENHDNICAYEVVNAHATLFNTSTESTIKLNLNSNKIISLSKRPLEDGGSVVTLEDITHREQAEERIRYLSSHDPLTGLFNRSTFEHILDASINDSPGKKPFCLIFIDLDGFKFINDTYGHTVGDLLLQAIAKRFEACVRTSDDIVARLGGDEFVIILNDIDNILEAEVIARRIVDAAAKPVTFSECECTVGASVGAAMFPGDASDGESLIKSADAAMYHAKRQGKSNFQFASRLPGQNVKCVDLHAA